MIIKMKIKRENKILNFKKLKFFGELNNLLIYTNIYIIINS